MVESAGLDGTFGIDLGIGQGVDVVAHAQHRQRGLVHVQQGKHAAHRRQLRRHRDQQFALGGVAEVLVDLLLDFGQRGAQLLHHVAHGLAVRYASVQLLHPAFERPGLATLAHDIDALRQSADASGDLGMIELAVLERRLHVQQRGGHLHRQRGGGLCASLLALRHRCLQRLCQCLAARVEPVERFADQRERFAQPGEPIRLATGHGRPDLLGCRNASARERDQGRIEQSERGRFVVDGGVGVQAVGRAHRAKARTGRPVVLRTSLGTEEQQVLGQPIRRLPVGTGTQLRQKARSRPLGVHVEAQQPVGQRLHESRRQLPQRGQIAAAARGKSGAQAAQPGRGTGPAAHD